MHPEASKLLLQHKADIASLRALLLRDIVCRLAPPWPGFSSSTTGEDNDNNVNNNIVEKEKENSYNANGDSIEAKTENNIDTLTNSNTGSILQTLSPSRLHHLCELVADDALLLRFLKKNKYDIASTKTHFWDHMDWRVHSASQGIVQNAHKLDMESSSEFYGNDMETSDVNLGEYGGMSLASMTNSALDLFSSGLMYFKGRDKLGRPLAVLNLSEYDTRSAVTEKLDLKLFFILAFEVARRLTQYINESEISNNKNDKSNLYTKNKNLESKNDQIVPDLLIIPGSQSSLETIDSIENKEEDILDSTNIDESNIVPLKREISTSDTITKFINKKTPLYLLSDEDVIKELSEDCTTSNNYKNFSFQISLIVDLKGYGIRSFSYDLIPIFYDLFNRNFPQVIGTIYVLNYTFFHAGIWTIVKQALPKDATQKLQFVTEAELYKNILDTDFFMDRYLPNIKLKDDEWYDASDNRMKRMTKNEIEKMCIYVLSRDNFDLENDLIYRAFAAPGYFCNTPYVLSLLDKAHRLATAQVQCIEEKWLQSQDIKLNIFEQHDSSHSNSTAVQISDDNTLNEEQDNNSVNKMKLDDVNNNSPLNSKSNLYIGSERRRSSVLSINTKDINESISSKNSQTDLSNLKLSSAISPRTTPLPIQAYKWIHRNTPTRTLMDRDLNSSSEVFYDAADYFSFSDIKSEQYAPTGVISQFPDSNISMVSTDGVYSPALSKPPQPLTPLKSPLMSPRLGKRKKDIGNPSKSAADLQALLRGHNITPNKKNKSGSSEYLDSTVRDEFQPNRTMPSWSKYALEKSNIPYNGSDSSLRYNLQLPPVEQQQLLNWKQNKMGHVRKHGTRNLPRIGSTGQIRMYPSMVVTNSNLNINAVDTRPPAAYIKLKRNEYSFPNTMGSTISDENNENYRKSSTNLTLSSNGSQNSFYSNKSYGQLSFQNLPFGTYNITKPGDINEFEISVGTDEHGEPIAFITEDEDTDIFLSDNEYRASFSNIFPGRLSVDSYGKDDVAKNKFESSSDYSNSMPMSRAYNLNGIESNNNTILYSANSNSQLYTPTAYPYLSQQDNKKILRTDSLNKPKFSNDLLSAYDGVDFRKMLTRTPSPILSKDEINAKNHQRSGYKSPSLRPRSFIDNGLVDAPSLIDTSEFNKVNLAPEHQNIINNMVNNDEQTVGDMVMSFAKWLVNDSDDEADNEDSDDSSDTKFVRRPSKSIERPGSGKHRRKKSQRKLSIDGSKRSSIFDSSTDSSDNAKSFKKLITITRKNIISKGTKQAIIVGKWLGVGELCLAFTGVPIKILMNEGYIDILNKYYGKHHHNSHNYRNSNARQSREDIPDYENSKDDRVDTKSKKMKLLALFDYIIEFIPGFKEPTINGVQKHATMASVIFYILERIAIRVNAKIQVFIKLFWSARLGRMFCTWFVWSTIRAFNRNRRRTRLTNSVIVTAGIFGPSWALESTSTTGRNVSPSKRIDIDTLTNHPARYLGKGDEANNKVAKFDILLLLLDALYKYLFEFLTGIDLEEQRKLAFLRGITSSNNAMQSLLARVSQETGNSLDTIIGYKTPRNVNNSNYSRNYVSILCNWLPLIIGTNKISIFIESVITRQPISGIINISGDCLRFLYIVLSTVVKRPRAVQSVAQILGVNDKGYPVPTEWNLLGVAGRSPWITDRIEREAELMIHPRPMNYFHNLYNRPATV